MSDTEIFEKLKGIIVEQLGVEEEIVNRPVLQIRDTRNVIIDPSCEGDLDNAQFIIDKWLSDLSTLKKDGRYKNLDKLNIQKIEKEEVCTTPRLFK